MVAGKFVVFLVSKRVLASSPIKFHRIGAVLISCFAWIVDYAASNFELASFLQKYSSVR